MVDDKIKSATCLQESIERNTAKILGNGITYIKEIPIEKNIDSKIPKIKSFIMENKSLIKTIIICFTAIICISIAGCVYYESNRYTQYNGLLIDKYKGKMYNFDGTIYDYKRNEQ